MAKGIDVLRSQATQIKNEVEEGRNSATRIGGMFADLVDEIEYLKEASAGDANIIFDADAARLLSIILKNLAYVSNQEGQDAAKLLIDKFDNIGNSIVSLTAVWRGGSVYIGHTLSIEDFRVTATYRDGRSVIVRDFSMNKTLLNSTSNDVTISFGGKSVTINVPALYNNPIEFVSVTTTQRGKAVGEDVDLSKITYTIRYQNGDIVEASDPNIISATPSTLQNNGDNEITISLDGYDISKSIIISVGGTKEVVIETEKKLYPSIEGSGYKSIILEYPEALSNEPKYIDIVVEKYESGLYTATMLRGATISKNDGWNGKIKTGSSDTPTERDFSVVVVENVTNDSGEYTGVKLKFQYTINTTLYSADWRTDYAKYTIDIKTYIP